MKASTHAGVVNELRARGFAVLPAPQEVKLREGAVQVDGSWQVTCAGVKQDDTAVRTLRDRLQSEHGLELKVAPPAGKASAPGSAKGKPRAAPAARSGGKTISLSVKSGTVQTGLDAQREAQAYLLTIADARIDVVGNSPCGLFYGVQTLLQLLDGDGDKTLLAPRGEIRDWPRYQLRVYHWDTKHHQDRLETLRRYLDWGARFKFNAVTFELEDKFEYPSHPVIGGPTALATRQLQELTDYGLERYIQIIPNVQAPAHMAYVLKHEEFAHLRCDGSNYMICMDQPEAVKLVFDMYDDVCKANKGVEYFHVSTDEVYYAGICERFRRPYNPVNRSLTLVDFVNKARDFLAQRGRRIIIWDEFPILVEHVKLLAPDILGGIMGGNDQFIDQENQRGIRQFAYCPIQGEEKLFPNYFAHHTRDGSVEAGRLASAYQATLEGKAARGNPIGAMVTAWDDAGLHNETFWLGWAAMAQGGWSPGAVGVDQTVGDFFDIYYGRSVQDMTGAYRDLQLQARFWEFAWDHQFSKLRGPAYGYSQAKRPVTRTDATLSPPSLPKLPDLDVAPAFRSRYGGLLEEAPWRLLDNDRLLGRLQSNLTRARRNRYNLEVLLSLAHLQRHFIQLLLALGRAEDALLAAAAAHKAGQFQRAVGLAVGAHRLVAGMIADLDATYRPLVATWEKSMLPRNASAGGRDFLHVMDDVKDHFADRRADLSYMIAPEESMGLPVWCDGLAGIIRQYAQDRGLSVAGLPARVLED